MLSCFAVILFAIGRGLAGFGQQYLGQTLGQDVAYDIRNKVYDNLQSLSYAYHDKVQTGQVMSRITRTSRRSGSSPCSRSSACSTSPSWLRSA